MAEIAPFGTSDCGSFHKIAMMRSDMHTATPPSPTWHPETKEERDAVLRELERVLQSPQFSASKRYPALLRFVVLRALAGDADRLKERTLGVEVFNRPPTYDTNTDTVVRYTAGEVRKRLFLFYAAHPAPPEGEYGVQISLPAGSYVPEFTRVSESSASLHPTLGHPESRGEAHDSAARTAFHAAHPGEHHNPSSLDGVHDLAAHPGPAVLSVHENAFPSHGLANGLANGRANGRGISLGRKLWLALLLVLVVAALSIGGWRKAHPPDAVEQFWSPVFRAPAQTVVCSGGVVFSQNGFSGTLTAGKDIDYPFVSMQIASAISRVSEVLERGKVTFHLQPCTSTPLSELRDHPVILLGGYNNTWTIRLLDPLRFHFAPEPVYAILDRGHPERMWARDRSIPYSNSDDYALIARFHDSTTGDLVIVLAGLGRNGTEAAAQFATSPAYMQLVRQRVGADLGSRNIEAVMKVHVVDGKTGAPTLEEVYVW